MLTDRSRIARSLCSSLAIATALIVGSGMAQAQSFQANSTTTFGAATVTTGVNTTTITVSSPSAVIDWVPFDTATSPLAINFQPTGTTATFTSTGNFAVLNRIIPVDPTRAIVFDGHVVSQIQAAGPPAPGGTVFFYSPGGVILSVNSVFDVGNLGLTSSAPLVDAGGNWYVGNQVKFQQATNAGSPVNTLAGSRINAPAAGSYVALVAPKIDQRGAITVNGAAALVSADAATITFNPSGLFNIQVDSGTSGTGTTLFNSGSITGPASPGPGITQRIFAVAVPKNTAITMAIASGSTLGFNIAGAADVVGNAIVLSGGFDIIGGTLLGTPSGGGGTGQVDTFLNPTSVTSAISAASTGQTLLFANSGQIENYASNVSISGATPATRPTAIAVQANSTGAGSQLNIAGNLTVAALDPTRVAPTSGFVTSNFAVVDATNGGNLNVTGNVTVNNDKSRLIGSATASSARIAANGGSQLVIGGNALVTAIGFGGDSSTAGVAVGNGTGGQTQIDATGANTLISIGGFAQQQAAGYAGNPLVAGALPGTGRGGTARITASLGGRVAVTGNIDLNAQGSGSATALAGTDGSDGIGGIIGVSQASGGRITAGGSAVLRANGFGGANYGGGDLIAGNGTGGDARIAVNDPGGIAIGVNVIIDSIGVGGDGLAASANSVGGTGRGGLANIGALNGANTVGGTADLNADGFGGSGGTNNSAGGAGLGGSALIGVIPGTTGAITIGNGGSANAAGIGGNGIGGGPGAAGTGGTAQIFAQGGNIDITGAYNVAADASGGTSVFGNAGSATGGNAQLFAQNGSQIRLFNAVTVSASATGGTTGGGGAGGSATGGFSSASVDTLGRLILGGGYGGYATADGGTANVGAGGNATSGTSQLITQASGGSIAVTGDATVVSQATGGNSTSGAGGAATSVGARIIARAGALTVSGQGIAIARALGGSGLTTGGAALGGDAALIGGNGGVGGAVTVNSASLLSDAVGGAGGIGGSGTGGTTRIIAKAGSVTVTNTLVATSNGDALTAPTGGIGGAGIGGVLQINAQSDTAGSSTIAIGNANIAADGKGGAGGAGTSGGGAGGAGGAGTGGSVAAVGAAGNGNLSMGNVVATTFGVGGAGGVGGTGATGGTGGIGGQAVGGSIQIGTASFLDNSPINTGSATFGSLSGNSSAVGGAGGAGGSGTTQGVGGQGGAAFDGSSIVLVRGSPVTFNGAVSLTANATGGNGGTGSTAGVGGNATVGSDPVVMNPGGIGVVVTSRFMHPEQPGRLNAGTIIGTATATGGTGSTRGASLLADSPVTVEFTNSSGTIGTLDLRATATTPGAIAAPSLLTMTNATAAISNLALSTSGTLSLALDTATLNSANVSLSAANFLLPATAPTAFGTINVSNSLSVTTGLDFLAYANLNLAFNASLTAPRSIQVGNVVVNGTLQAASGGNGTLTAGNISATSVNLQGTAGLTTGSIASPGAITLRSLVAIATGAIQAGSLDARTNGTLATQAINASGSVFVASAGALSTGAIRASAITGQTSQTFTSGNLVASGTVDIGSVGNATVGTVQAGQLVKIRSSASILAGDLTSGGSVDANANGQVTVGNVLAGIINPSTVTGEKFNVGIGSTGGPVTIGNIAAIGFVGVGSGLALTTGAIAGRDIQGFVGSGPATFGSINTGTYNPANGTYAPGGRVLIELGSQFTLGGNIDSFDPELVFAAPALPSVGSITINGVVSTGSFRASTNSALTTAAVTSTGSIDMFAGGTLATGRLIAGDTVAASAGGALNVAGASAGIVNPSTATGAAYNVALRSLASLTTGALSALGNIGLSSPGTISVGNLVAGPAVLALAGTGLTTGSISTGASGRVYLANFSMEALAGQIAGTFNPAPIFAAPLVAITGPIAINGAVNTSLLQASTLQSLAISGATLARGASFLVAGTTLATGNVTVGDRAIFAAGGNLTLGNVDAGITLPTTGLRKIAIGSSSGSVNTGTVSAGFDLGIQAAGAINTGALTGRQILLLAGTNVSTGAISAIAGNQPVGPVFIGNVSMANQTSNVFQTFTGPTGSLPVFNLQPVRVGGAITLGGAVVAGSLTGAAAQGISLQAVTTPPIATQSPTQPAPTTGSSGLILLDSGGTVTVNGRIAAGNRIDIASRDIDITPTGSIDALSVTGEIQLESNNPNGAFIGDGLTTTSGYVLSAAEYGRLRGGHINIIGQDISGLATDLTVGTLTINASQLYGANGLALFASGNSRTSTPSGILRIAGAVTGNGFGPTTELELLAGTVELEAEKGSIRLNGGVSGTGQATTSSSLGGIVVINADSIHVASDAILTKLRADPLYTGHVNELNAPAAVQRPDGVLSALGFDVIITKTFYIQNTGSRAAPAGFLTTFGATDVFVGGGRGTTGTAEIVINGQFQTATGNLTGKAAYDLVAADPTPDTEQFARFSTTSQLNGCVFLSGVCAFGQSDPVAALSSEIATVTNATLDESPVAPAADDSDEGDDASSNKDDDDDTTDEGSSPISPPAPLISTRALDGNVNVVEPVSGAGNPALFGSAVDETTVQGEKP